MKAVDESTNRRINLNLPPIPPLSRPLALPHWGQEQGGYLFNTHIRIYQKLETLF